MHRKNAPNMIFWIWAYEKESKDTYVHMSSIDIVIF